MRLTRGKVLNTEEMIMVHKASLKILSDVGILIKSKNALEFLDSKGLNVDYKNSIVKFSPEIVMSSIESAPREFEVFSIDKSYSLKIGKGNPSRTAAGHNGLYLYDYKSNKRTSFTKDEVGRFARLADNLDNVDLVATQSYPQDVNYKSCLLHGVETLIENTIKPIVFAPEKEIEIIAIIEMLKVLNGSDDISKQPIGICQFSPSSPLFWNSETIDGLIRIAKTGFPCIILPGVLAGATAPYGIVGALVQKNAEILAGITIAQLAGKGIPLLYRNGGNRLEMRKGANLLGTPESFIFAVAGNQMAQYYDIPSHGCTPDSDSSSMDEQTGIENMFSLLSGFESGTDLMINVGMFGSGKISSYEQAVIDNEIIRIIRRYIKGVEVNEKTLMVDAIKRVGPLGNYLGDSSTLENLKSDEFTDSDVLIRSDLAVWAKEGSPTMIDKACNKVEELLNNEVRSIVNSDISRSIKEIIKKFELENK